MSEAAIIVLFVAAGLLIGGFMYGRTSGSMTSIMKRLAAEKNGVLESRTFLRLPKLILPHKGKQMAISAAFSGEEGSSPYTYALFEDVESSGLTFRILPKSAQTVIDRALGLKKATVSGDEKLDEYLSISTNDEEALSTLLSGPVQRAIMGWITQKRNRIQDIRLEEGRLIFCVDGFLNNTADFRELIDGACLLYDAVALLELE